MSIEGLERDPRESRRPNAARHKRAKKKDDRCYFCVSRGLERGWEIEDLVAVLPRNWRDAIRCLEAQCIAAKETQEKTREGLRIWELWYCVRLGERRRLDHVRDVLRKKGLVFSGPWMDDGGRVGWKARGSGPEKRIRSQLAEIVREKERAGRKEELWKRLMRLLFGTRDYVPRSGTNTLKSPQHRDDMKEGRVWQYLEGRYPLLGNAWNDLVDYQASCFGESQSSYDWWCERIDLLCKWAANEVIKLGDNPIGRMRNRETYAETHGKKPRVGEEARKDDTYLLRMVAKPWQARDCMRGGLGI